MLKYVRALLSFTNLHFHFEFSSKAPLKTTSNTQTIENLHERVFMASAKNCHLKRVK